MFKTLRDLYDSLLPASADSDPNAAEHALRLAAAVMLVEVMRADGMFHPDERAAVQAALRHRFELTADEAARLAELADAAANESTDLFSFTSQIDERFEMAQKVQMIELMWRVAYADGQLSEHERHVMWRIADLLHVPQGAYVNARMRAREAAGSS
jgi:uncharacterized tellurite resistance protein B-like protein